MSAEELARLLEGPTVEVCQPAPRLSEGEFTPVHAPSHRGCATCGDWVPVDGVVVVEERGRVVAHCWACARVAELPPPAPVRP